MFSKGVKRIVDREIGHIGRRRDEFERHLIGIGFTTNESGIVKLGALENLVPSRLTKLG